MRRILLLGALVALGVQLTSCRAKPVSLSGRACEGGECAPGWDCDPATNTCVSNGEPCEPEGREISCGEGLFRVCERGLWSSCQDLPLGEECEPTSVTCQDEDLVTCTVRGFVGDSVPCQYGCNDAVSPARCNECVPNSTFCDRLTWVTCNALGKRESSQDCRTGSSCRGVGTCDPVTGCGVAEQAPDGTACDEGAGYDGNWCNSSCVDGSCRADFQPECIDGNPCTLDVCEPTSGCSFDEASPEGAPCPGQDGDWCTSTCDGSGVCRERVPVDCDDSSPCTVDACVGAGDCVNQPGNQGVSCRPAGGACDLPEYCNGTSPSCPTDELADASEVCRPSLGLCDTAETCDGQSKMCPSDQFRSAGHVCRAAGECDLEERCTGDSAQCPRDELAVPGAACGDSGTSDCDSADTCDGHGVCLTNEASSGAMCGDCGAADCWGCFGGACAVCEPGFAECSADNRRLVTCDSSGTHLSSTQCAYVCTAGHCATASNGMNDELFACDSSAPELSPPPGATVAYRGASIECSPSCNSEGDTSIATSGSNPRVVCVSRLDLAPGSTFLADAGLSAPLVILVDGDANIDGDIVFSGQAGTASETGAGGPGGGDGGAPCTVLGGDGNAGQGEGAGGGGYRTDFDYAGGGGGAGYGGDGGAGGYGDSSPGGFGGSAYGNESIMPLLGGSGGGGGADGRDQQGGSAGGGGGGAIQLTVRGTLTINGAVRANGGNGGNAIRDHGAGGGGSGGAVLLEALAVTIGGAIQVAGGSGGSADDALGGRGAGINGNATLDGEVGESDHNDGGAGGGGGAGRVRVNSRTGGPCANVTPVAACTSGSL